MATAKDLLLGKTMGMIFTIRPDQSVQAAIDLLAEHNVGALLVMDNDEVKGILSERDIVRKVDFQTKSPEDIKVRHIMTEKVLYVEAGQSVEECMALMNEKNIRHLPVYEDGNLLGLISVRDVLRAIIDEQQVFITHLERYIVGARMEDIVKGKSLPA
jgi:CBS domain-containing protein